MRFAGTFIGYGTSGSGMLCLLTAIDDIAYNAITAKDRVQILFRESIKILDKTKNGNNAGTRHSTQSFIPSLAELIYFIGDTSRQTIKKIIAIASKEEILILFFILLILFLIFSIIYYYV